MYNDSIPFKKPTIVFVGTYPPRECGIATFTQDLLNSSKKFLGPKVSCKVAAFNATPTDDYVYPSVVAWKVDQNNLSQHLELARTINSDPQITGVILEHEYGIYGGKWGKNILYFMENCTKPMLVTLHTVLPNPTATMKEVTQKIIGRANAIVVLTHNSQKVLEQVYPMSIGKVQVIPHGVHQVDFTSTAVARKKLKLDNHLTLTTFGLLSRGKGIEYVIKALPAVIKKHPDIRYLILGKTHPSVQRLEGEKYRNELAKLVVKLKLKKYVKFYDKYLSLDELLNFLKATDIYISTSINPDQAVSGTLSYALGTGRAVVSTEFAQSKELITPDTGRLVPIKDSLSMSHALNELLNDPHQLPKMHQNAYQLTRPMLWSNVAKRYTELLSQSIMWPVFSLKYLKKMTDNFGLFQFASYSTPHKEFGYTIDDNCRAIIVCSWALTIGHKKGVVDLIKIYLRYIKRSQNTDGSFTNYLGYPDHLPTAQNDRENLSDANARTWWALAETINNSLIPSSLRLQAKKIFSKSINFYHQPAFIRSAAFEIKALILARSEFPEKEPFIDKMIKDRCQLLIKSYHHHSRPQWSWFEETLTYNNAVLPEALLMASQLFPDQNYLKVAQDSLDFLISTTFYPSFYSPIGNQRWYNRHESKSEYDQQPEDPSSTTICLLTAYKITRQEKYLNLAQFCFSWFLGNNSQHKSLYDYDTKGCYDGLTPTGVNLNQGAESLISYLLARIAISRIKVNEHQTN